METAQREHPAMPTGKAIRNFCFQALMALGALACILGFIAQFFDIKSKDLRMTIGWAPWVWLVCGLLLFVASLGSSIYSLRRNLRSLRESGAEHDQTVKRLETQHKSDEYRWGEIHRGEREEISGLKERVKTAEDKVSDLQGQLANVPATITVPSELPDAAKAKADREFANSVITMPAEEYRRKIESDLEFRDRVDNLPWDRKAGFPTLIKELSLQEKVRALATDLFAFLREKGPAPHPQFDPSVSLEEKLRVVMKANKPYIEGIHYGYLRRFKDRVIDIFHELGENGITDPEIDQWDIDPPQAVRAETVRKIAEHLTLIAAKIDIAEQSKGA